MLSSHRGTRLRREAYLLGKDPEGEVLHVRLNFGIIKFTANETLGVKDPNQSSQKGDLERGRGRNERVVRIHRDLILSSIADETLEGDVGRGSSVALIVGDNFDSVVLPDTNTTRERDIRKAFKDEQTQLTSIVEELF